MLSKGLWIVHVQLQVRYIHKLGLTESHLGGSSPDEDGERTKESTSESRKRKKEITRDHKIRH
jgi:hypothetical protein